MLHLDAWPAERRASFFDLALPPDTDPAAVDFSCVAGLPVWVIRRPGTSLQRTAEVVSGLMRARPVGLTLIEITAGVMSWSTPIVDTRGRLLVRELVEHFETACQGPSE